MTSVTSVDHYLTRLRTAKVLSPMLRLNTWHTAYVCRKPHGGRKMKITRVQEFPEREKQVDQCRNLIVELHNSSFIFKRKNMHLRLLDYINSDVLQGASEKVLHYTEN